MAPRVPGLMSTAETVARTAGFTKRFGELGVLDGVDLEIRRGEFVAPCGRNGLPPRRFAGSLDAPRTPLR